MAIGIRPTVDYAFKRHFGDPGHERLTLSFLNSVLAGRPRIERLEFLNPLSSPAAFDAKQTALDVLARDERQRLFNIEMQTALPRGITERFAFYAASLPVGQLRAGMDYLCLRPAISVWVLDGLLFPQVPDWHLTFELREPRSHVVLSDLLEVHALELPKRQPVGHNAGNATALEKWAYFLNFAHLLTVDEIARTLVDSEYVEAAEVLEMMSQNELDREVYEARLKLRRDEAGLLKMSREEGIEIGRAEGEARGRAEGTARGVLIGQLQMLEQLQGLPVTSAETLASEDLSVLELRRNALQRQLQIPRHN